MSEAFLEKIITALITAAVTGFVAWVSSRKAVVDGIAPLDRKTDGLVNQVAEVHTLTNSNMSAANSKLDRQADEIKSLHDIVSDLKNEREKQQLAVAVATPTGAAFASVETEPKKPPTPLQAVVNVEEMNVETFKAPDKK